LIVPFGRQALAWLALTYAAVRITVLAGRASTPPATGQPKNIIILFADGAAPVQWDFGKRSSAVLRQQPFATNDIAFCEGVLGLPSMQPHDVYVTDSAAAASAMSTGYKVENGAVSITPDGKPQKTVYRRQTNQARYGAQPIPRVANA
jgi:alkaline phosphatase